MFRVEDEKRTSMYQVKIGKNVTYTAHALEHSEDLDNGYHQKTYV